MKIGIICNDGSLSGWQAQALARIAGSHSLYLLNARGGARSARKLRHALYYLVNLASIRNRETRAKAIDRCGLNFVDSLAFDVVPSGSWEELPEQVIAWVRERQLDVLIKFGMGLVRVPPREVLPTPIISYHHGDPRHFRGRPAGFYELLQGAPFMGQIVQILSNKLDQGEVLAFAETRVAAHSYKKTLTDAFRLSGYLLPGALSALAEGRRLEIEPVGRNYRLPNNLIVARFVFQRLRGLAKRLVYAALLEKRWEVSVIEVGADADPATAAAAAETASPPWQAVDRLPGYTFYADPFFRSDGALIVEALSARSGKGELVQIGGQGQTVIRGFDGHVSYPGSIEEDGRRFFLPEIASWSRPAAFTIEDGTACRVAELDIDAGGILDPTLHRQGEWLFLFGNRVEDGASVLRLWVAKSIFGRFEEHPQSPIRISARGSRMGGNLVRRNAGLFRPGQDFRRHYGDGILLFRIEALSATHYCESVAGETAFEAVRGPHTLNFHGDRMAVDWYRERLTPMAGVRRLMGRF